MNDNDEQCFKTQCGIWEERFLGLIAFYLKKKRFKSKKIFRILVEYYFAIPQTPCTFITTWSFVREKMRQKKMRGETPKRDSRTKHDFKACVCWVIHSFYSVKMSTLSSVAATASEISENFIDPMSWKYKKYILKFVTSRMEMRCEIEKWNFNFDFFSTNIALIRVKLLEVSEHNLSI